MILTCGYDKAEFREDDKEQGVVTEVRTESLAEAYECGAVVFAWSW